MGAAIHSHSGRISEFGLVGSLLMAISLGVAAFFATCFLAIFGILFYNIAGHHVDFADSYKFFALPAGAGVLVLSLALFLGSWLRRKFSKA